MIEIQHYIGFYDANGPFSSRAASAAACYFAHHKYWVGINAITASRFDGITDNFIYYLTKCYKYMPKCDGLRGCCFFSASPAVGFSISWIESNEMDYMDLKLFKIYWRLPESFIRNCGAQYVRVGHFAWGPKSANTMHANANINNTKFKPTRQEK